ncbi:MAG: HAD family phosphatase [Bacteroidota bacterium]
MIDTIIFDLGGVLIDWNPRYLYRKIFDDEAKMEDFLTNITTHDWNELQDGGRSLAEATETLVAEHPDWEAEIRAFYGRWEEMLGGPIYGTVELLETLKNSGRYRMLALTNWSAETFPVAKERYDFLGWFEGILVSGEEMLKKPDVRIYQLMIERYQLDPYKTLFIDDSERNLKGASRVGLQTIHFQSPMQLRERLADTL